MFGLGAQQRVLSRVHALGKLVDTLASEYSAHWQKEAIRLEDLELKQGASGSGSGKGLSHEDTSTVLEGLGSQRWEATLNEDFCRDNTAHI